MRMQRTILILSVCFSIVVVTVQTLSWARASNRQIRSPFPSAKSLQGLNDKEKTNAIERWRAEYEKQKKQRAREHINRMAEEAWKHLLKVNEKQWAMMEPKINKIYILARAAQVRTFGSQNDTGPFRWKRPSRPGGPLDGKSRDQMTEQYRIMEELIDLLEDKESTDAQIREKMDTLQQTRDNARKELAQVGCELAAIPMTPRQEAIFLLVGYIP